MRLYIDVLQGFVVRVHSTLGTMQIVAPFHTGLENGHELTVGYSLSLFRNLNLSQNLKGIDLRA